MAEGLFLYTNDGECNGKQYWRCDRRRICNYRIHTIDGVVVHRVNAIHTHTGEAECDIIAACCKERAITTTEQIKTIITKAYKDLPVAWSTMLPNVAW